MQPAGACLTRPDSTTNIKEVSAISFGDISFVVQGAIDPSATPGCLDAIRRWYPGAEIVLSTWETADVSGLDYDVLVRSADPGAYNVMPPHRIPVMANGNRQIVSTKHGIQQASRPYVVKLRSDIELLGREWMRMWGRFPERTSEWRMFRERVIIGSWYARNPLREVPKPFHPSDWFMFGRREDLLLLWDIELEPEPESAWWFQTRPVPSRSWDPDDTRRYYSEQYLWKMLMSKFGDVEFDHFTDASPENVRLTQLTFANNLIILEPHQFPFVMVKYPNPKAAWRYACYSHREWLRLYRYYCCGNRLGATLHRALDLMHHYESVFTSVPKRVRTAITSRLQRLRKAYAG